jgi:hypothetical protein
MSAKYEKSYFSKKLFKHDYGRWKHAAHRNLRKDNI